MARDVLYVPDTIPSEYCYARYGSYYIDLFKDDCLENNSDFYRIYLYDNTYQYEHLFETFTETTILSFVETSNDWHYRRDLPSICFLSLVEIMIIIIFLNLVTSVFKKGGIFSGLL